MVDNTRGKALQWETKVASAEVTAIMSGSRSQPCSLMRQGRGQGVDLHHQAEPPGQEHEDQVPGRDLPLFFAPIKESEITNFFLMISLKDEAEDFACAKADLCRPADQVQSVHHWRLQHFGLGVKCSKEVATAICKVIMLAKLSHHSCVARLLE